MVSTYLPRTGIDLGEIPVPAGVAPRPEVSVLFLEASYPADVRAWLSLWESWPGREIMAHPFYVRLFARPGDRVICAAERLATGGILYPFILRKLNQEPWATGTDQECDLITAYGYGGPFSWNVSPEEGSLFWTRFDLWARQNHVVSSFARLSLYPQTQLPFHGSVITSGPSVVRELVPDDSTLWMSYEGKVRRNVLRARRDGVRVEFDDTGNRLDDFLAVYTSTMDRRQALEHYYFPRSFFESLITNLEGRFFFAHALHADKVISSDLILFAGEHAYFFLGGTDASSFALRPSDLLKHEGFLRCRDRGIKQVILGGGYRPDDGILRFKRSFAPGSERPFRLGVKTYDAETCARLVECRRLWERGQGRDWTPAPDFFPPYRSGPSPV